MTLGVCFTMYIQLPTVAYAWSVFFISWPSFIQCWTSQTLWPCYWKKNQQVKNTIAHSSSVTVQIWFKLWQCHQETGFVRGLNKLKTKNLHSIPVYEIMFVSLFLEKKPQRTNGFPAVLRTKKMLHLRHLLAIWVKFQIVLLGEAWKITIAHVPKLCRIRK